MSGDNSWNAFRVDCIEAMERFQSEEIGWPGLSTYIDKYDTSDINSEVRQFIWDVISEIDRDPEDYQEVLDLLRKETDEGKLLEYMNGPVPPIKSE